MKLKLNGVTNRDELITAIDSMLDLLDVDFNQHCLNGVNLYLNVYEINGNRIAFMDGDGEELDCLVYNPPKKTTESKVKNKSIKKQ